MRNVYEFIQANLYQKSYEIYEFIQMKSYLKKYELVRTYSYKQKNFTNLFIRNGRQKV